MRRDTQIGIILGIVILVIIGVFLSTRTSDNEAVLPELVLSEGVRQESKIDKIDIDGIFNESKNAEKEETLSVKKTKDNALASDKLVKLTQLEKQPEISDVESSINQTSLEGKWEGVAEEITEDDEVAQKIISAVEEVVEEERQTPSYAVAVSTDDIYYKVQSNDSLFKIAREHYGDGKKWVKIFDANNDSMPNPNSLYVGQKLLIPGVSVEKNTSEVALTRAGNNRYEEKYSNVDTHTVEAGDTLYRIAEKYYNDPSVWTRIYEANEDTIEDKGLLNEGQVLIIPKL